MPPHFLRLILSHIHSASNQLASMKTKPPSQIPANEENDPRNAAGASSSPEEELARRFKDVMRRIFWDRFTQSLLPPPGPTTPAATAASGRISSSSSGSDVASASGSSGQAEAVVTIPRLPPLRVGSKVHARYGSERGSYYAATVVGVGSSSKNAAGGGGGRAATAGGGRLNAGGASERGGEGGGQGEGRGTGGGAAAGEGAGVYVDVRYDEDGMVEKGVPVSRLKKSDDPPDFGPLLALLGEVSFRGYPAVILRRRFGFTYTSGVVRVRAMA